MKIGERVKDRLLDWLLLLIVREIIAIAKGYLVSKRGKKAWGLASCMAALILDGIGNAYFFTIRNKSDLFKVFILMAFDIRSSCSDYE